ncbi:hypothetical protein PC128_g25586 [Phytophthora cactorum]|nr:hypothetical protein PC128_g25586 [Phytophthora cactorum]
MQAAKALEVQLLTQTGLRENAELFARQATAEIEELKAELKRAKDSDAARLRRCMYAQVSLDASTKTTEKLRQFIKSIQESTFRSNVEAPSITLGPHQGRLVGRSGDAIEGCIATQPDPPTDSNQWNSSPAGGSSPLEVNIAKAVHHSKKPGKRRRLRRAGSSSELSPSPLSNSEDSKRRQFKPSGSPKAAFAAAGLTDVPGTASYPSPSKCHGLGMPKAWRKTKPAKKRRAALGPTTVPPKDRPAFKATDPWLRDSPAAPAAPLSPSPSPIIPSVAAPASGPLLAVTQGPAQASLSTGDSCGARVLCRNLLRQMSPSSRDVQLVMERDLLEGRAP